MSPDLPLVAGWQFRANKDPNQSALFGCFADVEPDGWGRTVIGREHARQRKQTQTRGASAVRTSITAPVATGPSGMLGQFDYLLWVGDVSRVGAIRFRDADGVFLHAAKAGINAATARVVDSKGVPVAVITRFDRVGDRAGAKRRMYLSARSLMDAAPDQQHTYVDIANTIRMHSSQAAAGLAELWRRMAFNILVNNVDDHLNNHGFLHQSSGQWALAPAFAHPEL